MSHATPSRIVQIKTVLIALTLSVSTVIKQYVSKVQERSVTTLKSTMQSSDPVSRQNVFTI
jgi:hypothetical protein